jgi:hypothetical protein
LLDLQIHNLNWKKHTAYVNPKLSSACFATRIVTPLFEADILKLTYFAYFHSIMSYGVIFWGNSTNNKRVFITQKKTITIVPGVKRRVFCRELFKKFNILLIVSEFLLTLPSYIVDMETKQTMTYIHVKSTISISQVLSSLSMTKALTMQRSNYSVLLWVALKVKSRYTDI